eukprot:jgi/Mesvir1/25006/Mv16961-RA.1
MATAFSFEADSQAMVQECRQSISKERQAVEKSMARVLNRVETQLKEAIQGFQGCISAFQTEYEEFNQKTGELLSILDAAMEKSSKKLESLAKKQASDLKDTERQLEEKKQAAAQRIAALRKDNSKFESLKKNFMDKMFSSLSDADEDDAPRPGAKNKGPALHDSPSWDMDASSLDDAGDDDVDF